MCKWEYQRRRRHPIYRQRSENARNPHQNLTSGIALTDRSCSPASCYHKTAKPSVTITITPYHNATSRDVSNRLRAFSVLTLRRKGASLNTLPIFTMSDLFHSDQFISFSTVVADDPTIMGLQSRKAPLKLPLGTYPIVASSWFPSPKGHPLYSANPSYMEIRKPTDGLRSLVHGAFLLNSNAMDVILEPSKLTFKMTGGIIDAFVFAGTTPDQFTQQYQSVIGRPMMPPLWATGFHQVSSSAVPTTT